MPRELARQNIRFFSAVPEWDGCFCCILQVLFIHAFLPQKTKNLRWLSYYRVYLFNRSFPRLTFFSLLLRIHAALFHRLTCIRTYTRELARQNIRFFSAVPEWDGCFCCILQVLFIHAFLPQKTKNLRWLSYYRVYLFNRSFPRLTFFSLFLRIHAALFHRLICIRTYTRELARQNIRFYSAFCLICSAYPVFRPFFCYEFRDGRKRNSLGINSGVL